MTTQLPNDNARHATAADIERILVQRTGVAPETLLGNHATALVDLGVDSLAVLELQSVVSSQFGVEVPDDALLMSVEGLAAYVRSHQGGGVR